MKGLDLTSIMFIVLFFKHFIIDFPLQGPYQYLNKGTYGHPGGILHAFLHMVGTVLFLGPVLLMWGFSADEGSFQLFGLIVLLEGVLHYHIDWAKMNIINVMGWEPTNSEQFWWLLGLDQFLHYMTYAAIIFALGRWS